MVGEAVWYKWTAVSSQPSEVEGPGKQSNCFVGESTSKEFFGIFVLNPAGEPANREGDQTDESSCDERHSFGPSSWGGRQR